MASCWNYVARQWKNWTPSRVLVAGFLFLILIGTILLRLPIAVHDGHAIGWVDALFMATSAICVTGLTVVDTASTFTMFGEIVIIVLVQIGGIGFMTVATLFYLMLGKKISLRERLILQEAMNTDSMEGIVRIIRRIIIFVAVIQASAALILALHWLREMPLKKALYYGLFHSVSLFNNGGLDLFGNSFQAYADDFLFNIIAFFLIVSGGLGFIVLAELYEYPRKRKFSLHSKVVLSMTAILIVVGAAMIFVFEYTNPNTLQPMSFAGKIYSSVFQSISSRSSGTSTVDIQGLRQVTQFFMVILMFIGGSPGSAGGGIKTTTFAILICAVAAMLRGREDAVLFRTRLSKDQIVKALTIIFLALMMVLSIAMLLAVTEQKPFLEILFDTTSAVATVGLSMGLTPELSVFGKLVFCAAMFIGRLGPLTLAYALNRRKPQSLYRYPEGKIMIG
ncbi:TrkH family potassium uptake protein [Paenibacillus sp. ACRRX]|uniref:TrkH family potassium uptake protein n=1 Tax=unclassified Paenibacillus TaxID=185978 RepID=UPI001EF509B7|nr:MULTISPECIES: TrkH family potassium uptake protein [unclassified Paenibacillus]MCG7408184.1 TrkH family potassium uptake protein [Paenibacillus sp. ACRRX]MDK8181433.1 TrkH family potassium uptake protein [Paenibacillus sp. UMB4589-SE434]